MATHIRLATPRDLETVSGLLVQDALERVANDRRLCNTGRSYIVALIKGWPIK
jgi:hypothetical protein